jgi:hypothetical protein
MAKQKNEMKNVYLRAIPLAHPLRGPYRLPLYSYDDYVMVEMDHGTFNLAYLLDADLVSEQEAKEIRERVWNVKEAQ